MWGSISSQGEVIFANLAIALHSLRVMASK
jgi:hypothetical protein